MPRVPSALPTYDSPQEQLRPVGGGELRIRPNQAGEVQGEQLAAAGAGLQRLGQTVAAIQGDIQRRENADRVFRAETAYRNDVLAYTREVGGRRGENAFTATADAQKWFDDNGPKYEETLTNDTQRRAFGQIRERVRSEALDGVARHETKERRQSVVDSSAASITSMTNSAAANSASWRPSGRAGWAKDGPYETELSPEQEGQYQQWKSKLPTALQYEGDYDLRGAYLDNLTPQPGGDGKPHLGDKFKKPNHRSFSRESQYATDQAPSWNDQDQLVTIDGRIAFDERNPKQRDVDPVTAARDEVGQRSAVLSQLLGDTRELREARLGEALTQFHSQVFDSLVNQSPTIARAYYDENKREISAPQRNRMEDALKAGGLREIGQVAADRLSAAGVSESEGLAAIRKQYSGDEEAAAVGEWKTRNDEKRQARAQWQSDAADSAQNILNNGGKWTDIPVTTLQAMDPQVRAGLQKAVKAAANGEDLETDWDLYARLRREAIDDPTGFARRDLRANFGSLGKSQRESLLDLQGSAAKGDDVKLGEARSLDMQIKKSFVGLKLDTDHQTLAEDYIRTQIDAEQQRLGKKLSQDERQKVIDRALTEGEVENSPLATTYLGSLVTSDPNKRLYQTTADEAKRFEADDPTRFAELQPEAIPAADREQLVQRFRDRKGRAPTEDELRQIYRAWKQ